ncbi:MAG: hypothetical protein GF384_05195 [Elusimicrobia bacterium]|nr:hypothetical protein [Elusimicrobiota bacterium]MBD3412187.1 hypothetical protein [Elusimicrobiota bacterium]
MKKIICGLMVSTLLISIAGETVVFGKTRRKRSSVSRREERIMEKVKEDIKEDGKFDVYTDKMSRKNHYIPSGYMGDYGDIKVNDRHQEQPRSGKTCIRIEYKTDMSQGAGWAGIYWQNPANNWGNRKGGFNLNGAQRLTFWARGETGGEFISEFKVGGITGEYPDSDAVAINDIELTRNWKKYEIDLTDADLTYISGGFCWAASLANNPDGFVIYLDDIVYDFTDSKRKPQRRTKTKQE